MFQNRKEAGMLLSKRLSNFKKDENAIILAIPRGGVVVGKQISQDLSLPLSLVVVKKLGAPSNPELAIGALAPSGVKYIDWDLALRIGAEQEYLDREIRQKKKEVEERVKKFQISNFKFSKYKTFILVDDGIATGATTLAAIEYIKASVKRKAESEKLILAVPVIAKETYNRLQEKVDKIVALETPEFFGAVGEFYREFPQISDEEVIKLL